MRLIDANEIENLFNAQVERGATDLFDAFEDALQDAQAVDAVVVTRCKECAEFQQKGEYYNGTPFGYCYHWDYEEGLSPNEVDGNDFCSYGKRREG